MKTLVPSFSAHLRAIFLIVLCAFVANAKAPQAKTRSVVRHSTASSSQTILNLSDFGTVADGATDDGPALQRALDALAEAGGGTLQIPAGTYFVSTPVTKNFAAIPNARVNIVGVPSDTMPAHPHASGQQLAASLDLASEIIVATGAQQSLITLSNIQQLLVEHVAFTGRESAETDAFITLFLSNIDKATVRHCEFYGLSTFGYTPELGGGNVIRAFRSDLSIEQTVFLGCTANSGTYAPIVDNIQWRKFSISNSIFIDYGIRSFYGKMGYGAPLSWIGIVAAAPTTPEFPRREVIVRDTFLDEGGWTGISVLPYRWGPSAPIDLIYISGLRMNVSNLWTAGHTFYDAKNLLIENSYYGWSQRTNGCIDIHGFQTVILDKLTCVASADRILIDALTNRATVINSVYQSFDSHAQISTVMNTTPEEDPVQYVRAQFKSTLGEDPEPAAHFYWSDLLIRCGENTECLQQTRSELADFLGSNPERDFGITGTVIDENGDPLEGATATLSGSLSGVATTSGDGTFRFSSLPTSGTYTVRVNKRHYSFVTDNQSFTRPVGDVTVAFEARLNRHSIGGWINHNGATIPGIVVRLDQTGATQITDSNGAYSFTGLAAGQNYTVTPLPTTSFIFEPVSRSFNDLSSYQAANFWASYIPVLLTANDSNLAVALDAITFVPQPFSLFNSIDFFRDGYLRVVVFAENVAPSANLSQVSMLAVDEAGGNHSIEVEFMGNVPGQSRLKQINLKLSGDAFASQCLDLRLSIANVNSNNARICLAEQ